MSRASVGRCTPVDCSLPGAVLVVLVAVRQMCGHVVRRLVRQMVDSVGRLVRQMVNPMGHLMREVIDAAREVVREVAHGADLAGLATRATPLGKLTATI